MDYLDYDRETGEYSVRMSRQDFLDVLNVVEKVCATPELQDFTALGTYTLERTQEVAAVLRRVYEELIQENQGPDCTFKMSMRDFLDTKEVVLNVRDSMGPDISPLFLSRERVKELGQELYGILNKKVEMKGYG